MNDSHPLFLYLSQLQTGKSVCCERSELKVGATNTISCLHKQHSDLAPKSIQIHYLLAIVADVDFTIAVVLAHVIFIVQIGYV